MHLYLDSANISDAQTAMTHGIMHGLTTNPSLIAKEPPHPLGYLGHLRDLIRATSPDIPISVQPPLDELQESTRECFGRIQGTLQSRRLLIKIPVSWDTLPLIKQASALGIHINATCVFTPEQAIAAIHAGARYVSFFWCRMNDASKALDTTVGSGGGITNGGSAEGSVSQVRHLIDDQKLPVQIIAGSIRTPTDAMAAFSAGAHIVTTSPSTLQSMCNSTLSDKSSEAFETARKSYASACDALNASQAAAEEEALKAAEAKPSDQGHSPEPPPPETA